MLRGRRLRPESASGIGWRRRAIARSRRRTAREALARAGAEGFDLALLDATLPGRGGLDVCRELRRRGFDGPVILLTSGADVADRVARTQARRRRLPREALRRGGAPRPRGGLPPRGAACAPAGARRRFGGIEVDLRGARVLRDGRDVSMSPPASSSCSAASSSTRAFRSAATAPRPCVGLRCNADPTHGRRPRRVAPPQARGRRTGRR